MAIDQIDRIEKFSRGINDGIGGVIDIAYMLHGALGWKRYISMYIKKKRVIHYNPHIADPVKRIVRGQCHPEHVLLIVDDSYLRGISFREAVRFFQEEGYSLDRMFGLHTRGGPKNSGTPMLHPARKYLEDIFPKTALPIPAKI